MFSYNVILLLEAIKHRPCLWDKTLPSYKDRAERRAAWEDVFSILDPKYAENSEEQKRDMSTTVINKWANVRDTFIRTIKGNKTRRYVYHDHMEFLMKIIPKNEEGDDDEDQSCAREDVGESSYCFSPSIYKIRSEPPDTEQTPNKRQTQTPVEVEVNCTPVDDRDPDVSRVMNEDEAFFASLLPTVARYDEQERLEFRIKVLGAMKKIIDKRQGQGVIF